GRGVGGPGALELRHARRGHPVREEVSQLLVARAFGELLELVRSNTLPRVLLPERLEGFEEGVITDNPAEHVEDHGAFVEYDGLVLGRKFVQLARLADRRDFFVGER